MTTMTITLAEVHAGQQINEQGAVWPANGLVLTATDDAGNLLSRREMLTDDQLMFADMVQEVRAMYPGATFRNTVTSGQWAEFAANLAK